MKSAHYMQLYRYFAGILKNCCLEKTVGGVSYILSGWNENVVSTKDLHLVITYKTFAAVQALRHVSLDMYSKHPTLGYPFIL